MFLNVHLYNRMLGVTSDFRLDPFHHSPLPLLIFISLPLSISLWRELGGGVRLRGCHAEEFSFAQTQCCLLWIKVLPIWLLRQGPESKQDSDQ